MRASVGDSGTWVFRGAQIEDLTDGQAASRWSAPSAVRSRCTPRGSDRHAAGGLDGLWRYAKPADIVRLAARPDLDAAARGLVELAGAAPLRCVAG